MVNACPDCGKPWSEHHINLNEWEQPAYRCEPPVRWSDYMVLAGAALGLAVFWTVVVTAVWSILT